VSDRGILYATTFIRALATGMIGVLIGLYVLRLGFDATVVGWVVGAGLAGTAVAALLGTLFADRAGRRRALIAVSLLGAAGAGLAALASTWASIVAAAFIGMLNGMGRDRGAALIIEQSILPGTAPDTERTRAFAWYNVLQDAGHALGGLLAGVPVLLTDATGVTEVGAHRAMLVLFAALGAAAAVLYTRLSPAVEPAPVARPERLSPDSRAIVVRISALFAVDSLAGGFLTTAVLSFFFFERFGVSEAVIGLLFFGARIANAASHLAAAWLARRIGLVRTMVFTHIPSSLLLVTVAFAPSFPVAAALFLLREGLVEMDVPTRQSYVMAVVQPHERTVASGVTQLVRVSAWAVAPFFAGSLMLRYSLMVPLLIGAGMKIAYDVLLYLAFRRVRPPEESVGAGPRRSQ
jgi:MFS family permease